MDNISRSEFDVAIAHVISTLTDAGLLFCLFNPFMTDMDQEGFAASDNPTKEATQVNYTDQELRRLFPQFELLEFKRYAYGFRGLFLRKLMNDGI